jgi:ABC-2 type transport system ATP-binding protein
VSAALLAVRGVRKAFGELVAVEGLSFEVRPGEIFGFLGPNGAGKTTTLRMLMGITSPDAGEVVFDGRPSVDATRAGYLPEERGLYEDMPVVETLAYLGALRGMREPEARAAARGWLERLGLADRATAKVQTLSKGNQQKVQFAGAVLHRPALAVLDEPFAGLDPLNQDLFLGLMRGLREQGTAVLLSAHHLDLVERLADRFLLISKGRALLAGTLEEIRAQATGGRDEVVSFELAARGDAALDPVALPRLLEPALAGAIAECRPVAGGARLEVIRRAGGDLGGLLSAVAARATVRGVRSHALPLHEIYVRAVRSDPRGGPAEGLDLG